MSTVIHLTEQDFRRNASLSEAPTGAKTAVRTTDNAELPQIFCQRERNGSWSVWIEEQESVIRQHWGASKPRLDHFKETVASLGLAIGRGAPNRVRFSIVDVSDEPGQREVAASRLAAFRNLFLENREPKKAIPASPAAEIPAEAPARAPQSANAQAHPADKQDGGAARAPGSAKSAAPKSFPSLFTDEELEDKVTAEARKKADANSIDHMAVVKESYPRIASAIELTWGNVECENYMNKLILNDRLGRQGFPQPVLNALLVLYRRHTQEFKFKSNLDAWSEYSKKDGPV